MNITDKIKILVLADNPADVNNIQETLLDENIDFEIIKTENGYEFETALSTYKKIDLVIAYDDVPGLGGFTALNIVNEKLTNVPFILISDESGEEVAIESLKMGASDYVLKHRIYRLGPAVRRSIRESQEREEYGKALDHLLLLNRAFESSHDGIIITDNTKVGNPVIFVNKAYEVIMGYSSNFFSDYKSNSFDRDSKNKIVIDNLKQAIEEGRKFTGIIRNFKNDGTISWIEIRLSPVKNKYNIVTNFICIVSDVTNSVINQQEIVKLSQVVEQSPISVLITDSKGMIEYVNPRFEETTGYTASEVIGKHPLLLSKNENIRIIYDAIKKSIFDRIEFSGEFKSFRKNGNDCWDYIKVTPIKTSDNEIINYVIRIEDITIRKKAEEQDKLAKEKAEELSKLKTAFLSNMSHELRTPMIGIIGCAKILLEELTDSDQLEMAEIILSSSNRLTETMNQILDLSKIESGSLILNIIPLNSKNVVSEIIEKFEKQASAKKLLLKFFANGNNNILADEALLIQILRNLICNAIKYTIKGGVTVEIDSLNKSNEKFVSIKVKDTGIGISKENQIKIFEPFRQVSEGFNRNYEGIGLGLTITKKLVEMMNGSLEVESELGKGSVFTVYLPAENKTYSANRSNSIETLSDYNNYEINSIIPDVLIVEDDSTTREIIRMYIEDFCNVVEVGTGEDAITEAQNKIYDAVLLDIGLKGMNGIQVVQALRKMKEYEVIPIIAVTAYAMAGDKEKFLEAGCSHYLSKPFLKKTLEALVKNALSENNKPQNTKEYI